MQIIQQLIKWLKWWILQLQWNNARLINVKGESDWLYVSKQKYYIYYFSKALSSMKRSWIWIGIHIEANWPRIESHHIMPLSFNHHTYLIVTSMHSVSKDKKWQCYLLFQMEKVLLNCQPRKDNLLYNHKWWQVGFMWSDNYE